MNTIKSDIITIIVSVVMVIVAMNMNSDQYASGCGMIPLITVMKVISITMMIGFILKYFYDLGKYAQMKEMKNKKKKA